MKTIILSNTYHVEGEEIFEAKHVMTGIVGVFDSRDNAEKIWNGLLKDLGVPENEFANFKPGCGLEHALVPLGEDQKYCGVDNVDEYEWIIEMMMKDMEENKVYQRGE